MYTIVNYLPQLHDISKMFILFVLLQIAIKLFKVLRKALRNERWRIIRQHIRAGHPDGIAYCLHPDCQPLRHL